MTEERGNSISDAAIQETLEKLRGLAQADPSALKTRLIAMGYVSALLAKVNITPIVVGGTAVGIYTAGTYQTMDIDLVLDGRAIVGPILERLGFEKPGGQRHWYHPEIRLALVIPDNHLEGSMDRVTTLELPDGYIEDLVLDRIKASVYWKSESDETAKERMCVLNWMG